MTLQTLRAEIDAIDHQIVTLLGKRTEIARKIAKIKKREHLPILDQGREEAIKKEVSRLAKVNHLSAAIVEEMFDLLLDYTRFEMGALD